MHLLHVIWRSHWLLIWLLVKILDLGQLLKNEAENQSVLKLPCRVFIQLHHPIDPHVGLAGGLEHFDRREPFEDGRVELDPHDVVA